MGPGAGGAGSPPEPDADGGGRAPHLLRPTPVSLVTDHSASTAIDPMNLLMALIQT